MSMLDRNRYVLGDSADHVGFLNCETIAERRHIHGWKVEAHYHEGLSQLFVFAAGRVDGRIDYAPQVVHGPALVWLPALCSHAFDYPRGMRGWVITVPTADVARLAQSIPGLQRWIDRAQVLQGSRQARLLAEALTLTRHVQREHRAAGDERNAVLEALFRLLLVCLHRGIAAGTGADAPPGDRRQSLAKRFQDLVDRHLDQQRSVTEYARFLSVTPTHLSRSLKAVSGRTAGQIIHDRIVLEAKRRLVFTDVPVAEIAYALKFSSPSYFTRFFSLHAGESPGAFRRRMRAGAAGGKSRRSGMHR